ncbi:AAA family ATPase [Piscinibacter sp. XHJ-5]|uniref:AAA family ATPase n=1 Tax=Piscinibacter sp. XHJ-5 TaxID=3037797 RepID=UPI00245302D5|nr:AAA family ATPase [Piscinibacter sp. XHJ-5]
MRPIAHSERLIVVVGPSGAGKDSVLAAWRARLPARTLHFATRVVTRRAGASEAHESVDEAGFDALRAVDALATWWQANDLHYGVRWRELSPLADGGWVVLNGSREHLAILRLQAPRLHVVHITAPEAVLARRLAERSREAAPSIERRLARRPGVSAALTLDNSGALASTVDALHRWWCRHAAAGGVASRGDAGRNTPRRSR